MKIIEQSYDIWGETPYNFEEAILFLEKAGRVCYRSEDKIVEGSGIVFVNNVWERGHYSVLEMSNIVLRTPERLRFPAEVFHKFHEMMNYPKYLDFVISRDQVYIAGSWRAWAEVLIENGIGTDLENIASNIGMYYGLEEVTDSDEIPLALKKFAVKLVTDRAVTHEIVRHRPCSFLQESQRYVRYTGDIEFIKPHWYDNPRYPEQMLKDFDKAMWQAEDHYQYMLKHYGAKAEDARVVLPNATATTIVVLANVEEWNHIFNLRTPKGVYPQMRNLMNPLQADMRELFGTANVV